MNWFLKRKTSRSTERLTQRGIKFVGEQDGPSERDLKASFVEVFRDEPMVERAWLAPNTAMKQMPTLPCV
jgi:hypothetical protein